MRTKEQAINEISQHLIRAYEELAQIKDTRELWTQLTAESNTKLINICIELTSITTKSN